MKFKVGELLLRVVLKVAPASGEWMFVKNIIWKYTGVNSSDLQAKRAGK